MQSTLRDEDGNVLYRATLTYDAQNRLQTFHERTGDTYHKTAFTYDKDSRVTQMAVSYTHLGQVDLSPQKARIMSIVLCVEQHFHRMRGI